MPNKIKMKFELNGKKISTECYPMDRLLDVLRYSIKATGTKEGCGEGECGACSVILDGKLVNSCLIPAQQCQDAKIKTVEGLAQKKLHPLQEAFWKCGGAQCGICTPGMLLASYQLLQKNKKPTREDMKEALAGNLCRCTGYTKIFESIEQAAKNISKKGK